MNEFKRKLEELINRCENQLLTQRREHDKLLTYTSAGGIITSITLLNSLEEVHRLPYLLAAWTSWCITIVIVLLKQNSDLLDKKGLAHILNFMNEWSEKEKPLPLDPQEFISKALRPLKSPGFRREFIIEMLPVIFFVLGVVCMLFFVYHNYVS